MKYIDADKLKGEIERQQRRLILLSNTVQVDMRRDCALQNGVYNNILGIITYLQQEQPEVDLDKEIERYFEKWSDDSEYGQAVMRNGACAGVDECKDIARHFAQWGAEHLKK